MINHNLTEFYRMRLTNINPAIFSDGFGTVNSYLFLPALVYQIRGSKRAFTSCLMTLPLLIGFNWVTLALLQVIMLVEVAIRFHEE